MYRKIIKNEVSESKLITTITTIFITVAALLVALATILSVNLAGSIDTLMEKRNRRIICKCTREKWTESV